jgi:hypothetical protein
MRQTKRWGRSHRRWPPARRAGGAKKAFVLPIRTMVPTNLCLCCARHEYECCVYARLTDRTPDPAFMDPAIRPRCVNFRGRDRRAALKLLRPFQPP